MCSVLFKHNQEAYEAALAMMEEKGRAAVIHPTGTGKSFIAFQLCADHPDKTVCWLSPSEYIFRTQLDNWNMLRPEGSRARRHPAGMLENIRFFTYAKLMLMGEEELSAISPDYIILDEFHRCGAKAWGQGVQRLLSLFPNVPVLGLSATNIRYLDGQRDMADELFDGNIASEMSLGGAIVRGILSPPKYVLSVYSYQKDLEKYQARVQNAKNKAVRAEADKYLEALKRALEQADGMDEVFRKHMDEHSGRYLVFCASYEHMQEMIAKAPEWFAKVDPKPHIYSVYAEDPDAEENFRKFKEDNSGHLKLLYCIDMLNEGIHVEDVSGVILLRPTVSPIIYKQQIGRALAAGKKKEPVIFDVVMNIENLYSIGTIEEEMQEAIGYYRDRGMGGMVVNEHFKVIDEVQDCVRLFRGLSDTLGASWDLMYSAAERYYQGHGNLEAPKRYKTEDGLSLGQWLDTQRKVRAGKVSGLLTDLQIEKLDALGMRWQGKREPAWERNYEAAKKYYEEFGHLLVKADEEYAGVKLGRWIAQMREYRRQMQRWEDSQVVQSREGSQDTYVQCTEGGVDVKNIKNSCLSPERIKALDEIGMVWDVQDYRWERNFAAAEKYYHEHGNLDVPYYYVDNEGIRLGAWIYDMRAVREGKDGKRAALSQDQIRKLETIGMVWDGRWDSSWERSYEAACRYKKDNGNLDIPFAYVTEDGCHLGRWIRHQRNIYRSGLSRERKRRLDAIGMV